MNKLLFVFVALWSLGACKFSFNSGDAAQKQVLTDPGDPTEAKAAYATATAFLSAVDGGNDGGWRFAGTYLRASTTESAWSSTVSTIRSTLGPLKTRSKGKYGFTTELEAGVPKGRYFVMEFESSFQNANVTEKVVTSLDNGQWRVAGYFVNKKFSFGGR